MRLPVRVLPEVALAMRDQAEQRFGSPSLVGRMLETDYMASAKFKITDRYWDEPVLQQAHIQRLTEAETIELLFTELRKLRLRQSVEGQDAAR